MVYSIKECGVSATAQHSPTIDSDANSTRACCGVKLANSVHWIEFSLEKNPNFNSNFRSVLSFFVVIQFSFLK